jgi:endonuclease/exonuclease/phosphatase family metal-dependent hydrolase
MKFMSHPIRHIVSPVFLNALFILTVFISPATFAQSNVTLRVMSANLNGNTQSYQPFALRIFQGTKPDVVCIQEFNYASTNGVDVNTPVAMREMIDAAFGTNFVYYREPFNANGDIPNGVISRYPIINSGSWTDTLVSNRGFAWAQIDLPGTNDLYVVSVHLLTSSASNRSAEAANLKTLMQASFPANAWIVVAGDFNAGSRTEACITTFSGYLTDFPVPVDNSGNSDTSANRNSPHDYVLPSLSFTNVEAATLFPTLTYSNGLVFDSRVYTNGNDLAVNFPPVQLADSGLAQHMAVMKDFLIPVSGTVSSNTAPAISNQPQSQTVSPGSNATFTVTATGTAPLSYQWLFNSNTISGATTNPFTLNNAQTTNAGNYFVLITNLYGSVTSSIAVLTVSNTPPSITTQPQSQSVNVGASPTFTVSATGTAPLSYQWLFSGTNIIGANTNTCTRSNVQTNAAGNYSVIVTNIAGSVTSSVAMLMVTPIIVTTNQTVIAQWNFNSATPDANTASGSTAPAVGSGTAATVGGISASFVGGDAVLDPAPVADNSAWTTTTYPAATANNKSAGVQFSVSTVGKQNLVISWSQRSSNTGGKYFRLQYSTNSGVNFVDFPAAVTVTTSFTAFTNDLSALASVNNNANFVFRIVGEFQNTATGSGSAAYIAANAPTSSYATGGTTRFDMVTVSGTAIVTNSTPAASAVLSAPNFSAGQFQMLVTGSAGSNYVVQIATNLAAANWLSLFTNASPFTFTDTNLIAPQKFYRVIAQP